MFRRGVVLLLLPLVLLTQSVAVFGHSHGGGNPSTGHDLRPHFHANHSSARHHVGHHHHGPDGHHHHHDAGAASAGPDSQPAQQTGPLSDDEHDSDAVFIVCVNAVITARAVASADELAVSLPWATARLFPPAFFGAAPPLEVANRTHAPPPRDGVCPLYLRKLALLI